MSKVLFGVIGLVVGAFIGAMFGGAFIGGTAAGVGVATGLSAGICSTVLAARDEGLLTDDEIDQVLSRAATDAAAAAGSEAPQDMAGSADDCVGVMERLRTAAAEE